MTNVSRRKSKPVIDSENWPRSAYLNEWNRVDITLKNTGDEEWCYLRIEILETPSDDAKVEFDTDLDGSPDVSKKKGEEFDGGGSYLKKDETWTKTMNVRFDTEGSYKVKIKAVNNVGDVTDSKEVGCPGPEILLALFALAKVLGR